MANRERICVIDGVPLQPGQRKYCSRRCRDKAYYRRKKEKAVAPFIIKGRIVQREPRRTGTLEEVSDGKKV